MSALPLRKQNPKTRRSGCLPNSLGIGRDWHVGRGLEVRLTTDGGAVFVSEQRRAAIECKNGDIAAPDFYGAHGGVERKAAVHAG